MRLSLLWMMLTAATACTQPPQERVAFPLVGRGSTASGFVARGWDVTLSRAQVGLGPAYFCVTQADKPDLCETPLVEWAATATLDALQPQDQALGTVAGVSGDIRSVQFDYAITWFNTQQAPSPRSGAPGGHSVQLEGEARKDGNVIHFTADVDLLPYSQGQRTVLGMPVTAAVDARTTRMTILVDPAACFAHVDFGGLLPAITPDADGGVTPDAGLPGPQDIQVAIEQGSRAYNALVLQMTVNARPVFGVEQEN